ncbi:MAG: hypothetical protein A2600_05805 [Candidatus Lambdaproteobacteria bacterium RIFOXYD1_FULL_56_27]|uniref:Uncharacterized protein n=1 Tax=Candidatus Lambdaproteobacteria bacterium RIFOXYD2_FULL_56_26 TaxID=1817773 RepID=A0A1F6GRF2_9PROT|nr:MAG: hypothetical protein A2426_11010 [Candidatus Lambdaproteobacteria bacterium RIFOXYC1_FULL_56_13]OGH00712.1 MAG: hypothetical protein A2557_03510 [Candidatus Lambdaproteobacteria bacterium RIFOXYD2_FULL_56_26]OGH07879.1 MAG: hypothetical protein A2600_05805 [Candidatus Lambdaproteobacteria bacterium RIFOXYD1_FULL_56_27]
MTQLGQSPGGRGLDGSLWSVDWGSPKPIAFDSPKEVVKNQTNFYSTNKFGAKGGGPGLGVCTQLTGF